VSGARTDYQPSRATGRSGHDHGDEEEEQEEAMAGLHDLTHAFEPADLTLHPVCDCMFGIMPCTGQLHLFTTAAFACRTILHWTAC
jgi:hypothetical protein